MTSTYLRKPGAYGSKEACHGAWHYPLTGTMHIPDSSRQYYISRGITLKPHHYRGTCSICNKDCALRSDGTVVAHVNSKLSRQRHREAVQTAIATAKTDLLALRNELLSEEDA